MSLVPAIWAAARAILPTNPRAVLRAVSAEPKSDLARAFFATLSQHNR